MKWDWVIKKFSRHCGLRHRLRKAPFFSFFFPKLYIERHPLRGCRKLWKQLHELQLWFSRTSHDQRRQQRAARYFSDQSVNIYGTQQEKKNGNTRPRAITLPYDHVWFLREGGGGPHRRCATECSSWSSVASKGRASLSVLPDERQELSIRCLYPPYSEWTRLPLVYELTSRLSVGKDQCLWFGEWRAARQHLDNYLSSLPPGQNLCRRDLRGMKEKQSTGMPLIVMWKTY